MSVAGILLAAGAGRRAGGPKALRRFEDGEAWVTRAARTLKAGGCDPVLVVVGAEASAVSVLVPVWALVVRCEGWAEGMGASLRTGLDALVDASGSPVVVSAATGSEGARDEVVAALVGLVDTPGVTPAIVARVGAGAGPSSLARAAYHGEPGHPVLLGRDHWAGVSQGAVGDRGARDYLGTNGSVSVDCSDLGDGADLDLPGSG